MGPATGEIHRELEIGIGGALIDVAQSHQAGLIVIGTRGRSDIASMLLGSVAHEAVHKSPLPVLVVPEKTGQLAHRPQEPSRAGKPPVAIGPQRRGVSLISDLP